ncbi:response regulator [Glaciimonas immobilis]|uniref:Two-component system capsular synthesis response regulator RcsB n=1 Tax=Glaciimonas immobilis TaxID=728004 RepID=A0A840RPF4_9BURK|nr:response regulator [Glaciimonas immobilis]KAF3999352.1 response regulator [Glaciimonas immobilis]MBB5198838.1 two-component system capsular synthesis response regulator RcsB [Glaciimonas immobilis]
MDVKNIKVILADDHPSVLAGIKSVISASNLKVVATACNSTEIIHLLDKGACDVLVADYAMPGGEFGDGIPMFEFVLRRYPEVRIVAMTMIDNPAILGQLRSLGVRCILSKTDDVSYLISAVHIAYCSDKGEFFSPTIKAILHECSGTTNRRTLSQRESEVLRLYVSGMGISEIAGKLHRSKQTVSSQKNSAMRKIGVDRDIDLFQYAVEVGLVPSSRVVAKNS